MSSVLRELKHSYNYILTHYLTKKIQRVFYWSNIFPINSQYACWLRKLVVRDKTPNQVATAFSSSSVSVCGNFFQHIVISAINKILELKLTKDTKNVVVMSKELSLVIPESSYKNASFSLENPSGILLEWLAQPQRHPTDSPTWTLSGQHRQKRVMAFRS